MNTILQTYIQISKLKTLKRKGWLERKLPNELCESVADHSFGVALLTLLLAPTSSIPLDKDKALKMGLLHDAVESYAGDITPSEGISTEDQQKKEKEALLQLFAGNPDMAEYITLWEEFEKNESPEAKFIKQMDKLEMLIQASVYKDTHQLDVQEFFDRNAKKITDPNLVEILNQLS